MIFKNNLSGWDETKSKAIKYLKEDIVKYF